MDEARTTAWNQLYLRSLSWECLFSCNPDREDIHMVQVLLCKVSARLSTWSEVTPLHSIPWLISACLQPGLFSASVELDLQLLEIRRKMSTHSLISYTTQPTPSLLAPSYASQPLENERTIAFNERLRRRTGDFVKHSKNGHARLKLIGQQEGVEIPVYGIGGLVQGVIELNDTKTEGVDNVRVKVWFYHLAWDTNELGHRSKGIWRCMSWESLEIQLPNWSSIRNHSGLRDRVLQSAQNQSISRWRFPPHLRLVRVIPMWDHLVMFSLASNLTDIPTAFTSNIQSQAEGYPRIYCLYRGIPASPAVGGFTYSATTL